MSAASPARQQAAHSEDIFFGAGLREKLVTAGVYGVTFPTKDELAFFPTPLTVRKMDLSRLLCQTLQR